MSGDTDYLGRRMACDTANVDRLLTVVGSAFHGQPTADVVATMETMIADIVFAAARNRADAHTGVDKIADDMKKYLNARFAQRDQRRDQTGHA